MFKGHPKGLYALALANTGERFGYYTMLAVFALFLRENFGLEAGVAGAIYSTFLGLVYFMPLVGGMMADKFGFGKMVTLGISVMFGGYLLLSVPLGGETIAMIAIGRESTPLNRVERHIWSTAQHTGDEFQIPTLRELHRNDIPHTFCLWQKNGRNLKNPLIMCTD